MKYLGLRELLFLVLVFVMSSCASSNEVTTESSTQSAAAVPGEKVPGEGGLTPAAGPGGASAGVHW
jgi:hypothetical protein